ncbi:unnamed protein product [Rhizoctonia solani]|nr:unnamed protein product [Rhizoctonia solani]
MGDAFTYTGSGGRDLKGTAKNPKNLRTAPQSSHQSFDHSFNKALKVSSETRKPVRVIRGFKLSGVYAPETGYRYDGLYIVERAWMDRGNNPKGWKVCKFAFRRIPGQPPIPRKGETSRAPVADVDMEDVKEDVKEEENEGEEEEVAEKPKRGRKPGPKSKAKPGPKPKAKVEEKSGDDDEGPEEEEESVPAKDEKADSESKVKEESEEKPKRGRKPKAKEEPEEEEKPAPAKKGRKPGPKPKAQSEPESEPVSKRGRKPKAQSEPEEEEEEGESVPPAKRTKVEEGPKKRGRPPKNPKK